MDMWHKVSLTEFVNRYLSLVDDLKKANLDQVENIKEFYAEYYSPLRWVDKNYNNVTKGIDNTIKVFSHMKQLGLKPDSVFCRHLLVNSWADIKELKNSIKAFQILEQNNLLITERYNVVFQAKNAFPKRSPIDMAKGMVLIKESGLESLLHRENYADALLSSSNLSAVVDGIKYVIPFINELSQFLLNMPADTPTLYVKRNQNMNEYISNFTRFLLDNFVYTCSYSEEYYARKLLTSLLAFKTLLDEKGDKTTLNRLNKFLEDYNIDLAKFKNIAKDSKIEVPSFKKVRVDAQSSNLFEKKH